MSANDQRPENRWQTRTHHVRVCLLEDCAAQDDELIRALEQRLGISVDERTADGIAREGLDCVGLCGIKQAVLVDDEPIIGRDAVLEAVDRLVQ